MTFEEELDLALPAEVPNRLDLIERSASHLRLITEANKRMNLTRISSPREAAVKHVLDSVLPWRFFEGTKRVLDAGTGAGFPGIPLSLVLPEVAFTLTDSVGKKAKFVQEAVTELKLNNVRVRSERAESLAGALQPTVIVARAVAPIDRLLGLFGKALLGGSQLLLFKGPDAEAEIAEAQMKDFSAEILGRYQLPYDMGTRNFVRITTQRRGARTAS